MLLKVLRYIYRAIRRSIRRFRKSFLELDVLKHKLRAQIHITTQKLNPSVHNALIVLGVGFGGVDA